MFWGTGPRACAAEALQVDCSPARCCPADAEGPQLGVSQWNKTIFCEGKAVPFLSIWGLATAIGPGGLCRQMAACEPGWGLRPVLCPPALRVWESLEEEQNQSSRSSLEAVRFL